MISPPLAATPCHNPWLWRLLVVGQAEDKQVVAIGRAMHLAQQGARLGFGTAAAKTGGDGDILLAVHAEGDRIALHRGAQPGLPQGLAVSHVNRAEDAVE